MRWPSPVHGYLPRVDAVVSHPCEGVSSASESRSDRPGEGSVTLEDPLDVGFVPAECPGAEGTGATRTSSLLVEELSRHHDLTVYVSSQMDAADATLPAEDRVEYVLMDDLPMLPHPIKVKIDALREASDSLERHDLVHSYSSAFIPVLADLNTRTVVTLNSYLPVCPKADMLYRGTEKCTGPGRLKCASCIPRTALGRRQGVSRELRATYLAYGSIPFVERSMERAADIDAFHAISPHVRRDYAALGFPDDRIKVVPHFYDEAFRSVSEGPESRIGGSESHFGGSETQIGGSGPGNGSSGPQSGSSGPQSGSSGAKNGSSGTRNGGSETRIEVSQAMAYEEPVRLLYAGTLHRMKGVHVLLEALSTLHEYGLDAELQIAGSGPYESKLERLTSQLGLDDHVEFLGYVDHERMPSVYAAADVFVYPGIIDEPFGRVMLEALATHTPVAASNVGSMDYIVGPCGELFEAGDPQALAAAVSRVLDDYEGYAAEIPAHVRGFAPDAVVASLVELHERVAGYAPPKRV